MKDLNQIFHDLLIKFIDIKNKKIEINEMMKLFVKAKHEKISKTSSLFCKIL